MYSATPFANSLDGPIAGFPRDWLDGIASQLAAFRADGKSRIIFDGRDRGHYSGYHWSETVDWLYRGDPTGLAVALLLDEMIEATIGGSRVELARVLREPGYVDGLREVLEIRRVLQERLAAPQAALRRRVVDLLVGLVPEQAEATSREVAICFRDALYSMDKGMRLHWLQCEGPAVGKAISINGQIGWYPTAAAFADALRAELPLGAHLARIGERHTAVGIRQLGRIAYLSSLAINTNAGGMYEDRPSGLSVADALDLDVPMQRYPEWIVQKLRPGCDYLVSANEAAHVLNHVALLPRDRLIWLAMLVEMAAQRMAATPAAQVVLTESVGRAVDAGRGDRQLPVLRQANWTLPALTLDEGLASLCLSAWEQRFLQPALEGLSAETFLPASPRALRLATREVHDVDPECLDYFRRRDLDENCHRLRVACDEWLGTREEVAAARRAVFEHNLESWLLAWGNREFGAQWEAARSWLKARLEQNVLAVLGAECARFGAADFVASGRQGVHLYRQSPKHSTYRARCIFNAKSEVTDTVVLRPTNGTELAAVLGLAGEAELPDFLQGWERKPRSAAADKRRAGWAFCASGNRERYVVFTICVNRANLPADLVAQLTAKEAAPQVADDDA